MERANRDIKTILRLSFGSSNFPRMRNRIMWLWMMIQRFYIQEKAVQTKESLRQEGLIKRMNNIRK